MRLPFMREISFQIEKEIDFFYAKLDFETKFLLINNTYSLKKNRLNIKSYTKFSIHNYLYQ